MRIQHKMARMPVTFQPVPGAIFLNAVYTLLCALRPRMNSEYMIGIASTNTIAR